MRDHGLKKSRSFPYPWTNQPTTVLLRLHTAHAAHFAHLVRVGETLKLGVRDLRARLALRVRVGGHCSHQSGHAHQRQHLSRHDERPLLGYVGGGEKVGSHSSIVVCAGVGNVCGEERVEKRSPTALKGGGMVCVCVCFFWCVDVTGEQERATVYLERTPKTFGTFIVGPHSIGSDGGVEHLAHVV